KDRAERKGISLTDRAVEYLISLAGTDLWMLYSEVEKISSWSAGGAIDIDDIKNTVYAGIEYNAFDLVNALKKRDAKEVFRIFETVNRNTESQMLLGALNWQYTSLAQKQKPLAPVSLVKSFPPARLAKMPFLRVSISFSMLYSYE
ncbi:hypothetical protein M1N66_03435, partial [Thermodesulfovibrionales bacterium]|nr:hypothetical protein [Thermodesulfovibrionales bacterium]